MVERRSNIPFSLLAFVVITALVAGYGIHLHLMPPIVSAAPAQQGQNRAAVVVRFSDTDIHTRCVSFSEPVISGEELLKRSGFSFEMSREGNVCRIETVGCPASNCYCQCPTPECLFWGYFHLRDSGWEFSLDVPIWYDVYNGAVEGWSWGAENFSTGVPPPLISFDAVCPPVTLTPPDTLTPTATVTQAPRTATATMPAPITSVPTTAAPTTAAPTPTTPAPSAAPQVEFQVDAAQIAQNTCTRLRWQVQNASQVTLDGQPVNSQDQKEVCPTATQRYVLVANNTGGQTVREVSVQVIPAPTSVVTAVPPQTVTGVPLMVPSPAASQAGTATPPEPAVLPITGTPTLDTVALIYGAAASPPPTLKTLPAGPTATALLRLEASPTPVVAQVDASAPSSPRRLLILASGLLLGAGALFVIVYWVLRHNARPER